MAENRRELAALEEEAQHQPDQLRRDTYMVIAALLLLAAAAVACGLHRQGSPRPDVSSSLSSPTPSRSTATETFVAWTPTGVLRPGLKTLGTASGSCLGSSDSVMASDAFRCNAGNLIYDPCFGPPGPGTAVIVACFQAPWDGAELLRLTSPLPAVSTPVATALAGPWALELNSGLHCIQANGALPAVGGDIMFYTCDPSNNGLAGDLDTSVEPWTAKYAPSAHAGLETQPVRMAWY